MSRQIEPGEIGWHPDPAGRFDSRYWDGGWTRAVMRDGEVDTDPEDVPPAAFAQGAAQRSPALRPAAPARPRSAADRFTSLAPEEAQSRLAQMLAIGDIALVDTAPGRLGATVTVAGEPNWIIVVVLCFFWLLPGIVYWYTKSRPVAHPLSLDFLAAEPGTLIMIQGDPRALERLAPVLAQLPW
jgi:hypothetical protein